MNSQAQMSAAQQLAQGGGAQGLESLGGDGEGEGDDEDDDIPDLEAPEEDGPVDETGVDPKDIDLVVAQVGCSRAKAVRVLKDSGGDLINASTGASYSPLFLILTSIFRSHGSERVILDFLLLQLSFTYTGFHAILSLAAACSSVDLTNLEEILTWLSINCFNSANVVIRQNNLIFPSHLGQFLRLSAYSLRREPDVWDGDQFGGLTHSQRPAQALRVPLLQTYDSSDYISWVVLLPEVCRVLYVTVPSVRRYCTGIDDLTGLLVSTFLCWRQASSRPTG